MDFIKNKPTLSKKLWMVSETVDTNTVQILVDPETSEKITRRQLSEFIAAYGINNITIGDNPIIGYGSNGKYGVVTINQYSYGVGHVTMSQQHIFTTEFTAT
jgi:hypothetical protein